MATTISLRNGHDMPSKVGKGLVKGAEAFIKREGYPREKGEVLALARKNEICFSDL